VSHINEYEKDPDQERGADWPADQRFGPLSRPTTRGFSLLRAFLGPPLDGALTHIP
jgi:hypothetical protein